MINGTAHISSVPTHRVRPVADSAETGSESRQEQSRRALVPAGERRDYPRRSSYVGDRQLPQSARLGPGTLASLQVVGSYQPRGLRADQVERHRYYQAYAQSDLVSPTSTPVREKSA